MNKNGFTLIELLGVIVLVSLLMILVLPKIVNSIKDKTSDIDEATKNLIYQAANLYISDNNTKYKEIKGNTYCININDLVENEYLKSPIELLSDEDAMAKTVQAVYDGGFNYKIMNKEECIKTLIFPNGTPVYFDVEDGDFCLESKYKSSYDESLGVYSNSISGYNGLNGTGNQNSCLRFYAFNDDGSNKINLLLDHNTTDSFVGWDELYTISDGPVDALVTLYNDTDNWNGTLTPTNYTYTNDSWITYEINYSGHKARLITAEEVAKITGNTNFNSKTAVYDDIFYLDTNSQDISETCNSEGISGCKYNWMIEQYTSPYHTATTLSDGSGPWGVSNWDAPQLTTEGIYDSATNMGIRPVIEVLKEKLF